MSAQAIGYEDVILSGNSSPARLVIKNNLLKQKDYMVSNSLGNSPA